MSTWPPPQDPIQPNSAAPQVRGAGTRPGCGRALAITIGLAAIIMVGLTFFNSTSSRFLPILEESVAVVRIDGAITDSESTVKLIRRLRKSPMVKAMVLRIDSPGGGVAASEEIYREALQARTVNHKPLIVSMGSVAASGGYYIASSAEHIFATSGTITGSIGVIAPMFNARETLEKLGVRETSVVSGEHKDTGDPFGEQTQSERALIQGMVYDMYRQFFQVVLSARHEQVLKAAKAGRLDVVLNSSHTKNTSRSLEWAAFTTGTVARALSVPEESETALRRLADGRVYTGEQALKVGLVDSIGTLQDAVDYAGKAAGLGEDPPTIDRSPQDDSSSWLFSGMSHAILKSLTPRQQVQFRAPF